MEGTHQYIPSLVAWDSQVKLNEIEGRVLVAKLSHLFDYLTSASIFSFDDGHPLSIFEETIHVIANDRIAFEIKEAAQLMRLET